jgi:hypothetical protein
MPNGRRGGANCQLVTGNVALRAAVSAKQFAARPGIPGPGCVTQFKEAKTRSIFGLSPINT